MDGGGQWPLEFSLHCPSEEDAQLQPDVVRAWRAAWEAWNGPGNVTWGERRWRVLGVQRLPERLSFLNAEEVAAWNDDAERWRRARVAFERLSSRWPALRGVLPRHFDRLAEYDDHDIDRLETVLTWIERNPRSNLYPRQLPVASVDTKWIDDKKGLLTDLVGAVCGSSHSDADFHDVCGLKRPPFLVRVRILDPDLCHVVGGLSDVTAPVHELATLAFHKIETVYIVENLQTGLCLGEVPGGVVIMGLGNSVGAVRHLPWVNTAPVVVYWGDIDTHGFAILNHVRRDLPRVVSMLMDEETLLAHRSLWTTEREQFSLTELSCLSPTERHVYQQLKNDTWGPNVRLEQERIAWSYAWSVLRTKVTTAGPVFNNTGY